LSVFSHTVLNPPVSTQVEVCMGPFFSARPVTSRLQSGPTRPVAISDNEAGPSPPVSLYFRLKTSRFKKLCNTRRIV